MVAQWNLLAAVTWTVTKVGRPQVEVAAAATGGSVFTRRFYFFQNPDTKSSWPAWTSSPFWSVCAPAGAVVLQKSGKDSQTLAVRRRVNLSTQGQGQEMRKQEQGTKDKSALEEKPGKKLRLEQREPSKSSSGEDCPLVGSRQFASPDVCEGDTLTLEDFPATSPGCCPTHAMAEPGTLTNLIRPPHKSLRRRQRSKTDVCGTSSKGGGPGHDHTPTDGSDLGLRRLLEHWQYHCRWILAYIYITVLGSLVLLAVFFWFLRTPVLWM